MRNPGLPFSISLYSVSESSCLSTYTTLSGKVARFRRETRGRDGACTGTWTFGTWRCTTFGRDRCGMPCIITASGDRLNSGVFCHGKTVGPPRSVSSIT